MWGRNSPGKESGDVTNKPLSLSFRLEGPHHHYSDSTRTTKPNHHVEPHGPRSSPIRGTHLPGAALQLTGEPAWEGGGNGVQRWEVSVCWAYRQIRLKSSLVALSTSWTSSSLLFCHAPWIVVFPCVVVPGVVSRFTFPLPSFLLSTQFHRAEVVAQAFQHCALPDLRTARFSVALTQESPSSPLS